MFRVLLAGLMAVVGMSAYIWYTAPQRKNTAAAAPPPVTVSVVSAAKSDIPVLLSGIGTVQALNSVQIRSRIDGTLETVNFTEGQEVKKDDLLATIDPRLYKAALDQAKAKKAQDEAQLANDTKDLERSRTLAANQFASQQSFDQMAAKVAVDRAIVDSDEAQIKTAETNLGYTKIMAPFDGQVGLRSVDPGNIVRANDTAFIATLTQHQPISIVFTLPENQLSQVREGMKNGEVPAIAFDQEGKKQIATGRLEVVDNQVDQTTGTIKLKALFANKDGSLWPGQYAPVQVQVGIRRGVIAVPTDALQRGPNGLFVWVVKGDKTVAMAPVDNGITFQNLTVVQRGLNEGDQVVTSNQYKLRPKVTVSVEGKPVAANDQGGKI